MFMDSLPPFIAFGLTVSLHLPLCMGLKTALIVDPLPNNQGKMFFKYKPNYYVASPAQIEAIFAHPKAQKADLSFFKLLATGGDALPAASEQGIIDFLRSHNCQAPVFQGYGMSELAATVCTGKPSALRFGTVGIPLPNTNVKILDMESGEELAYGCSGEVCIHAPSVMVGYYNDPDETAKIIRTHQDGLDWVHTGDIGLIDEDGFLKIIGRIKRIITVFYEGLYHKIYPKLLEEQLETIEGVQSAVIVSNGTYVDDQKLIAFVVASSGCELKEEDLRQFAATHFKEYEQPFEYRFLSHTDF